MPPFLTLPKQNKADADDSMMPSIEERKVNEVAVGGGGVAVAVTRFPSEQKRPIGPLIVVGVRDGVLWLIDRYGPLCIIQLLIEEFILFHIKLILKKEFVLALLFHNLVSTYLFKF